MLEKLEPLNALDWSGLTLAPQTIGNNIQKHDNTKGLPCMELAQVALIGIVSTTNNNEQSNVEQINTIRANFYRLLLGNWNRYDTIIDLGNLPIPADIEEEQDSLATICKLLTGKKIIPIILGGNNGLLLPLYRSLQQLERALNIVIIDKEIAISNSSSFTDGHYMHDIINLPPNFLGHYANIGYQSFYCAQEELDMIHDMHFDALRLGDLLNDNNLSEPFLRVADLIAFNMKSLAWHATGNFSGLPNGIDGRTACALCRYAGLGDRSTIFSLFDLEDTAIGHQLAAQMIWYFLEGLNCRFDEYPIYAHNNNLTRYNLTLDDNPIVFYKSEKSLRWWMAIKEEEKTRNNKTKQMSLIPCTKQDYLDTCNNKFPELWYKSIRRLS